MPPLYRVEATRPARRQLERLPAPIQARLRLAIRALATDPRPPGATLLSATHDRIWRIRVGDYRVVYEVQDDRLLVLIVSAAHRREIYRRGRLSELGVPYGAPAERPLARGGRSWTREILGTELFA